MSRHAADPCCTVLTEVLDVVDQGWVVMRDDGLHWLGPVCMQARPRLMNAHGMPMYHGLHNPMLHNPMLT